ncbi:MAG: endo-1,4-beta-xylanase [Deltaproteobacteria bacterium]|nr:endo-1,4-beta-xylanase [Deltaproteobacteria bacterium]
MSIKAVVIILTAGAGVASLGSCVTRDLEPIGAPLQFSDSSSTTDTLTDFSTDTISDTSTITDFTDTGTAVSKESDEDTETASSPDNSTDTMNDTLPSDTDTGTHTSVDTTLATDIDTVEETESTATSDSASETDPETDSGTETGTAATPVSKWVGSATQNETYPYDFFDLWDQVTPENAGKWGEIESVRDVMDWGPMDTLYSESQNRNITFKAHTLVWYRQQPGWLNSLSAVEQAAEVEEWIDAFCSRYPNIPVINVVAMPFHDPPPYSGALGGEGITGYDWLINVFEMARNHCPGASLLMEEYNALVWQTHEIRPVAKILNDRGLLDGIGCVGRSLVGADSDGIVTNINSLASLGLPLYISGLEITNAADQVQRDEMARIFPLLYEHPAIAGITFWGYVEGQIYTEDAFLRHADGTPRPALTWLMGYLESHQ